MPGGRMQQTGMRGRAGGRAGSVSSDRPGPSRFTGPSGLHTMRLPVHRGGRWGRRAPRGSAGAQEQRRQGRCGVVPAPGRSENRRAYRSRRFVHPFRPRGRPWREAASKTDQRVGQTGEPCSVSRAAVFDPADTLRRASVRGALTSPRVEAGPFHAGRLAVGHRCPLRFPGRPCRAPLRFDRAGFLRANRFRSVRRPCMARPPGSSRSGGDGGGAAAGAEKNACPHHRRRRRREPRGGRGGGRALPGRASGASPSTTARWAGLPASPRTGQGRPPPRRRTGSPRPGRSARGDPEPFRPAGRPEASPHRPFSGCIRPRAPTLRSGTWGRLVRGRGDDRLRARPPHPSRDRRNRHAA